MEGPGWCTSIPETKNYYTRPWVSLTLNDANCPHKGCLAPKGGGGGQGAPVPPLWRTSGPQWLSALR